MNKKIKEFQQQLIDLINSAELPVSVIRLCFNDIMTEILKIEKQVIEQEEMNEQTQQNSVPEMHEGEVVKE